MSESEKEDLIEHALKLQITLSESLKTENVLITDREVAFLIALLEDFIQQGSKCVDELPH